MAAALSRAWMQTLFVLALENFTVTFLVLGLIASALSLARKTRTAGAVVEALLSYFLLFSIGLSFLYNAVLHVFFGDLAAGFIGWQPSPFQREVGTASLGFGVVGLLAFRGGLGMRIAAVVGPSCFLLGAAAGRVYQMMTAHNYAPGNAGVIFCTDIAVPIIGAVLLRLKCRRPTEVCRRR